MEGILKKRHPNSIPVLMWAASNGGAENQVKSQSVQYLEGRIKKLEREIEQKDEEGKRGLRAMEQKFNAVKVRGQFCARVNCIFIM